MTEPEKRETMLTGEQTRRRLIALADIQESEDDDILLRSLAAKIDTSAEALRAAEQENAALRARNAEHQDWELRVYEQRKETAARIEAVEQERDALREALVAANARADSLYESADHEHSKSHPEGCDMCPMCDALDTYEMEKEEALNPRSATKGG